MRLLSIWLLAVGITVCSSIGENNRLPIKSNVADLDIPLLHQEKKLTQRRTNSVAVVNDNVTCSICQDLGVPINMDVIPNPDSNLTCAELEFELSLPENRTECIERNEHLVPICCDTSRMKVPLYECNKNVKHETLLKIDKLVSPFRIDQPLVIDVGLSFQSLQNIDVKLSTASLFVSIDLSWNDPRLAWNKSQDFCCSSMNVKASVDAELTEIWVPDFDLLNRIEGLQSWSQVRATVRYDGKVTWYRQGMIVAACAFTGLRKMPFDTLGCQFGFGGLSEIEHIQYNAISDYDTGKFVRTYAEFTIDEDMTEIFYYSPSTVTEERVLGRRGIVIYNFFFERNNEFYLKKIIIPSILFTYVSFGLFLLDLRLGERLGFGISVLLVNVAQDIITNEFIPICEESLWMVDFVQFSTYWIHAALFETIFISWFYYKAGTHKDDDDLFNKLRNNDSNEVENVKDESLEDERVSANEGKKDDEDEEQIGTIDSSCTEVEVNESLFMNQVLNERIQTTEIIPQKQITVIRPRLRIISEQPRSWNNSWNNVTERLPQIPEKIVHPFLHMTSEQRLLWINKIDLFCMFLYPISYSLFIIIMWSLSSTYEDSRDIWMKGEPISEL